MKHISIGDRIFDVFNYIILTLIAIICLYPVIYVIFASVSEPSQLISFRGLLYKPLGFTLDGYKMILKDSYVLNGYKNTLFYVAAGVATNMVFTILGAYVISRRNLMWKKAIMIMITITMFFGGGLIPFYLLVKDLGMLNSWTALVFPYAINTWNMIVMRTGFEGVPVELEESARMDGANDLFILVRIILPLSQAVCAVIFLYYLVGAWNSWFPATIFLRDRAKYPLQVILREILIASDTSQMGSATGSATAGAAFSSLYEASNAYVVLSKYVTIVISTVPILCVYPFLQKYFVKGVLIGSLKG